MKLPCSWSIQVELGKVEGFCYSKHKYLNVEQQVHWLLIRKETYWIAPSRISWQNYIFRQTYKSYILDSLHLYLISWTSDLIKKKVKHTYLTWQQTNIFELQKYFQNFWARKRLTWSYIYSVYLEWHFVCHPLPTAPFNECQSIHCVGIFCKGLFLQVITVYFYFIRWWQVTVFMSESLIHSLNQFV